MSVTRLSAIAIALIFTHLSMAEFSQAQAGGNANTDGAEASAFGATLSIDQTAYRTGEAINVVFEIFNYTDTSVTFAFNSGKRYDFIIEDRDGEEVWRWSDGKMFTQALGEESLEPRGPPLSYKVRIAPDLLSGTYTIRARLAATNRQISALIGIEVQ